MSPYVELSPSTGGGDEEVLEYANLAAFPVTGTTDLIYVAQDTNKIYRWSSAAGVSPTTFNPADLASVTLSGGNLVATSTAAVAGARGIASITTGKYYWEYTYTTINTNSFGVGISTPTFNMTGASSTNAAVVLRLGSIQVNGSTVGSSLGTINAGNVIGVAVDFTARLIWFRVAPSGNWNGSGAADPATGTGGLSISALTGALYPLFWAALNDKVTANFGATGFTGTAPSGFTSGFGTLTGGYVELSPSTGGGGTPGGADTQVQFNNAGAFGGSANLTWNNTTSVATLAGQLTITTAAISIDAASTVKASAFQTYGTNAVLGPVTAGNVSLRPNGIASATNQLLVSTTSITTNNPVVLPADPTTALQATTKQYVDARASTTGILINGGFRINQGGYVSAAVLAAGEYGHDQWKAGAAGGTYSFTQLASPTQITIAASKTLIQPIEAVRVAVGGAYVLSWTGTAQARAGVNSLTPSGSYAASPLAIAGQTAGTVMSVEFNAGTLGTVKLESGTIATPFVARDYADELAACFRYFQRHPQLFVTGYGAAGTLMNATYLIPVMRSTPTYTLAADSSITYANCSNLLFFGYSASVLVGRMTLTAAGAGYVDGANVNLNARL